MWNKGLRLERLKDLIDEGWDARRARLKEESVKNSQRAKDWKVREQKRSEELNKKIQGLTVRQFKDQKIKK